MVRSQVTFLSLPEDMLIVFRERGREGEREEEKHRLVAFRMHSDRGDQTHNLGMCPDQESYW